MTTRRTHQYMMNYENNENRVNLDAMKPDQLRSEPIAGRRCSGTRRRRRVAA